MSRAKGRPGVMIYFELCDAVQLMTQEEKGDLLDAILSYGQKGEEPAFADRAMAMAWSRIRFDIQRDGERYEAIRERRAMAANKRWHPEAVQTDASASDSMQTMPAATATAAPSAAATPATAAAASPTAAAASAPSPAAETETVTEPAPGNRAPAPLRENGTHLPDCVAKYVPRKPMPPEEFAMRKQEWLTILRGMSDNA